MKYAVIYHSQTGNTKKIAEEIYQNIASPEKCICDMQQAQTVPEADVYFIGFGIRNGMCGIEAMNYLDKIKGGKIALFATCGFYPAEAYRKQLEHNLMIWLPDHAEYLELFLCQGRVSDTHWQQVKNMIPQAPQQVEKMLMDGRSHPDPEDMTKAAQFTVHIQQSLQKHEKNL